MAVRTHKFSTGKFKIIFEEIDGLCCDTDNPPEEEEVDQHQPAPEQTISFGGADTRDASR